MPLNSPKMNGLGWSLEPENIRHRIGMLFAPRSFCWLPKGFPMTASLPAWIPRVRLLANGENASSKNASLAWRNRFGAGDQPAFPPSVAVQVKALACELPHRLGLPLSRFTLSEIQREVVQQGIVASVSGATLWRWLSQDAIRPWRYRSWIFPRDPKFSEKAGPILDLYEGIWNGTPLQPTDYVLSADEKTSIQARQRRHRSLPPQPDRPMLVETEYQRGGAWVYLAAWDVRRAKCSVVAKPAMGLPRLIAWSAMSCRTNPIAPPHACFGSWIMARDIVGPKRSGDCKPNGQPSFPFTHRFTPVG
jgi:hypothetical protein